MSGPHAVVLHGSPRPDGDSAALAACFVRALGEDATVDDIHVYASRVRPCADCGSCAAGGSCRLDDAFPALMERVAAADVVVIASPLHFVSLTAPLIAFISRLQPYWRGAARLPERRRRGALLVTAGGRYKDMFMPARAVAAAAFKTLGVRFAGMATAADTDATPVAANAAACAEAAALARGMLTDSE